VFNFFRLILLFLYQYETISPKTMINPVTHFINCTIILSFLCVGSCSSWAATYPQRIVSLGPINTENVFLLGAGDRLVANTDYCVRPEAAKNIEKIGSVMQISLEKIVGLQPDLILATGLTSPQQLKQLHNLGVTIVRFDQPRTFSEICDHFLRLGQLLGLEKSAKLIIEEAKNKVASVTRNINNFPRQKVFLQIGSQPLFGSEKNSFTNDFIRLGGGINIVEDQASGTTNYEKVIARNPDVIIIAIMGSETGIAAEQKKNWQRFSVIKAVQNNRVHVINPNLVCSPSPATFAEALTNIANLIHPKLSYEKIQ